MQLIFYFNCSRSLLFVYSFLICLATVEWFMWWPFNSYLTIILLVLISLLLCGDDDTSSRRKSAIQGNDFSRSYARQSSTLPIHSINWKIRLSFAKESQQMSILELFVFFFSLIFFDCFHCFPPCIVFIFVVCVVVSF